MLVCTRSSSAITLSTVVPGWLLKWMTEFGPRHAGSCSEAVALTSHATAELARGTPLLSPASMSAQRRLNRSAAAGHPRP
jgi:hypothetical protein